VWGEDVAERITHFRDIAAARVIAAETSAARAATAAR
jgi:hypothetical protein